MTAMPSMHFFFLSLAILMSGSILTLVASHRNRLAHSIGVSTGVIGSVCGFIAAMKGLLLENMEPFRFFWASAELPLTLVLDELAAFFLVPVFLLVLVSSVYAARSLEFPAKGVQAARHWFSFNILAVSMALVVTAADSLTFLLAWEMMSLSSFLLVVYDFHNEQVRRAGLLYLIATHLGTAFLFLFFLDGYRRTGSLEFASLAILRDVPLPIVILFFFLALIGFGTKAGIFPLHSWLPEAHSAAPSHVSALMSGVMIKTAIYAFLRVVTLLPALPAWCGLLVAVLGILGALFGIALASLQTDMKRSLACSTIENIGIIFLGIGIWLYCASAGYPVAARLALAGALLHIWNHALFKSLLFMGAGTVYHATGTREISALGGLMRRQPFTGALMTFAAVAISALPPLNGFISELLIYLGLLHGGLAASGWQAFLFMIFAILLAMVGGMAALAMTRFIGIVFSGEPRTSKSENAHEAEPSIIAAMSFSALGCFVIGVFPQLFLPALDAPINVLFPGKPLQEQVISLPFSPAWSLSAMLLSGGIVAVLVAVGYRQYKPAGAVGTWGCGFIKPSARMSYTAGGYGQFSQDEIYCTCMRPATSHGNKNMLFPMVRRFKSIIGDPVLDRLFLPIFQYCADVACFFRRLQAGRTNIYLTYIFLATVLLLGWNFFLA